MTTQSARNSDSCYPDLLFIPVLSILVGLFLIDPYRVNSDCAFYLEGGRKLLEGGRLYLDWFDVNPPLIFYLNLIPAAVSRYTSADVVFVFHVLVLALIVWSTLSIREALLNSDLGVSRFDVGTLLAFWILFDVFVHHQNDFGQRDHLFILFFAPFVARRWVKWERGCLKLRPCIIGGLAAGIGVCLKPAFLVVPLFTEVYGILTYGKSSHLKDPGLMFFLGTGLIYCAHFFFLPADVFDYLFKLVVPLAWEIYPKHVNTPLTDVLYHTLLLVVLLINLIPFVVRQREATVVWSLARATSILTAGCFLEYIVQGKGFSYHLVPMVGATCLTAGLIFARSAVWGLSHRHSRSSPFIVPSPCKTLFALAGAFTAMAIGLSYPQAFRNPAASHPDTAFTHAIVKYSKPGDHVLALSQHFQVVWPDLLKTGRRQASRFSVLWQAPVFNGGTRSEENGRFRYHTPDIASVYELRVMHDLEQDLRKHKPVSVVLHDPPDARGLPEEFRLRDYLDNMGFMQSLLSDYEPAERIGDFSVYRRRTGAQR
ncbi:MAG TPA: hypothetical protein VK463_10055 [Desulfomonilaceae bacterium]|nr:hypothetical protein [Desulfomonilaceae bacterium]